MYKKVFIPIILLFTSQSLFSQKTSIEEIIASTSSDIQVTNIAKTAEYITGLNYNLPWLREVELRLGINGNATADKLDGYLRNEDYYAIKVSPNSLRERRFQQALKPAQYNYYLSNRQVLLQELIYERYLSVLNIYFSEKNIREKSKLMPLYADKGKLLEQMLELGSDIKFKDVVQAEYDKNDLLNDLSEYQNNISDESEKISSYLKLNDSLEIDFIDFISYEEVEKEVVKSSLLRAIQNADVRNQELKTQYALAEHKYQLARNRQILSFFQFGYSPVVVDEAAKTKFNPSNDLTFRFGVNVPIKSNNNLKRSETALKLFEEERETESMREEINNKIELKKIKILRLISERRSWEKQHEESLIPRLLKNESIKSQITPLELLDLNIDEIKLRVHEQKLDEKILLEYLELLLFTGEIADLSRNFLAADK